MIRHPLLSRLLPNWAPLFLLVATLISVLPALAQEASQVPADAVARAGTPSFLSVVDTTLRLWSGQFQKLGPYLLAAIAVGAAYLTGLIVFQAIFASGTFAPRAASVAAWFSALVLLFFGLMMLPQTWPWWAPYAVLVLGLVMISVIVSSLSKKAA